MIVETTADGEAMFKNLVNNHPSQLIALLLSSSLSHSDLTFAAEIAGGISDSSAVRPALIRLLDHPNPIVREGAIYGLSNHIDDATRRRLRKIADKDPSRSVRTAAGDALDMR
jgi:HEAT repeat protein